MIFIAGIAITLFLCALLVFKKNKSAPDKILLAWFFVMLIHQMFYYFDHSDYLYRYTFLIGLDFPIPLMHGPFLFLYASTLVNKLPQRKIVWLAHFLPAAICYLYLIRFYLASPEKKLFVIAHEGVGYETFLSINFSAIVVSGVTYVLLTLLLLRRHQKKIKDNFSDIEKINLEWLQYLTYGIGIIWLTVIFGNDTATFIAVVIFIMVIGFFGIKQTPVFTGKNSSGTLPFSGDITQTPGADDKEMPNTTEESGDSFAQNPTTAKDEIENSAYSVTATLLNTEKEKYQKSSLNETELQDIYRQLTDLMQQNKLYTNPELTLGDTAQQLNIHPNHLSQVINSVAKKNFYDYINSQRVEEFNRAVIEPKNQKFTLLSLAHQCGFNSKTSFNRNFRKATGLTPSQYLKQVNIHFDQVN